MRWRETFLAGALSVTLGVAAGQGEPTATDHSQPLATVDVLVTNVRNEQGVIRVSLCLRSEFLGKHCGYEASGPTHAGAVQVTLTSIMPGQYAIQAWHDENNNGKVDRDMLGIPREGVGFSNDPRLVLGPPSFQDSALTVTPGTNETTLRLRYFK